MFLHVQLPVEAEEAIRSSGAGVTWVLGTEPGSSATAVSALRKPRASPHPRNVLYPGKSFTGD